MIICLYDADTVV